MFTRGYNYGDISTCHWNYVFFFNFTSWKSTQIVPETGEDWDLALPCYTKHSGLKGPKKTQKRVLGFWGFPESLKKRGNCFSKCFSGSGHRLHEVSQPRATAQCGTPTCMTFMITGAYRIGSSGVIILNQTRSECASQSACPNALWHRG